MSNCCFICNSNQFDYCTKEYRRCKNCGHEILAISNTQGFIVNDPLCEKELRHVSRLDRFKARVLARFDKDMEKKQLLDIGSASGKFLYQNAARYLRATGIEVTPESLDFSRKVAGLEVVEDVRDIVGEINVATAWHSLEHIPEESLLKLLSNLSSKMKSGGRVVISVPNAASRQYLWFRSAYAYFDVPNHLHQFTPYSLELLMRRFGFRPIMAVNSWPYNVFGYTQSLLNTITRTHNYLYYRLKRRSQKPSLRQDLVNAPLLLVCLPIAWLLSLIDMSSIKCQGVITTCFEKSPY